MDLNTLTKRLREEANASEELDATDSSVAIMREAADALAARDGEVVVPKEPTEAMILAAEKAWGSSMGFHNGIRAVIVAALAAAPTTHPHEEGGENGWRDIADNPPKDGTKVDLLYPWPRGRTINCYWDEQFKDWVRLEPTWSDEEPWDVLPESQWSVAHYPNMKPTHWMLSPPLPLPPTTEQRMTQDRT